MVDCESVLRILRKLSLVGHV